MWSTVGDQKGKERRRLISLGLHRGPILSLTQCLHHSPKYQAPSQVGLRSPGRKVSTTGLHAPESQPEKDREREKKRERDKKRSGALSSNGRKVH